MCALYKHVSGVNRISNCSLQARGDEPTIEVVRNNSFIKDMCTETRLILILFHVYAVSAVCWRDNISALTDSKTHRLAERKNFLTPMIHMHMG